MWIILGAWLVAIILSYVNGNRRMPTVILILGLLTLAGTFTGLLGYFGLTILAILTVIIWIANKYDMA